VIGENCRALGFNVDFAPVLDLAYEASRKVMSSRAVSDDPKQVVAYAREFLRGLGDAGVLGCGKHFPGLGEATLDTHHNSPAWKSRCANCGTRIWFPIACCGASCRWSWFRTPRFRRHEDRTRTPASLSKKWITDILRKKIGYRGLICSDDLEMGACWQRSAPIEQAVIGHIRAGGDLGLICHQEEFRSARARSAGPRSGARSKFARRVQESARRVLAFKKKN
jgi:beta-N-acetylhexosaminidase